MKQVSFLVLITLFAGCAHNPPSQIEVLSKRCPKGSTKEDVISKIGAPQDVKHVGNYEVWYYPGDYASSCQFFFNSQNVTERFGCFPTEASYRLQAQEDRDQANRKAAALQHVSDSFRSPPAGNAFGAGTCVGFKPFAPMGCHMSCISGAWQSVCP